MRSRTHRPCLWLVMVLSSGILAGNFLPLALLSWLQATCVFITYFFFRPKAWAVYAALFCLGAALIHVAHPPGPDMLKSWRTQLEHRLYQYLDPQEAGTMSAIILGDRGHIPKEINMIFRHTGTGHILVIAGLHMAMMTAMVIFILKLVRIPRTWQGLLSIGLILTYAMLTGGSIPVMRAAFMASVIVASLIIELESDSLNSLCLAALALLLMDAQDLFDMSFQLSFAAVAAIILFYGYLEEQLDFCPRWMAGPMAVSTSAWLGIAPFQFWHFATFTPIALLANLFVVPLLDMTVALGLTLAAVGGWPTAGWAVAGCLKAVFNTMLVVAFWFSEVPFGYFQVAPLGQGQADGGP